MSLRSRTARWVFATIVAVVLAYTVWPTLWRIETACGRLFRINRLTGGAEVLLDDGWVALKPNPVDQVVRMQESERLGFLVHSGLVCPPSGPAPGSK